MSGFDATVWSVFFGFTWGVIWLIWSDVRKQRRRIDALERAMRLTRMALEGFK